MVIVKLNLENLNHLVLIGNAKRKLIYMNNAGEILIVNLMFVFQVEIKLVKKLLVQLDYVKNAGKMNAEKVKHVNF